MQYYRTVAVQKGEKKLEWNDTFKMKLELVSNENISYIKCIINYVKMYGKCRVQPITYWTS